MKVLRKCEQGVYEDMLFNSLEELRDYLRELHSYSANSQEDEESINNMSLEAICDLFEWSYEFISEEEAESIQLLEYEVVENSYAY